ncbi:MAG: MurR/RpiR family transcriptional regulator [Bacilli bacterium]|jgi:DNA-binding MurR/RpiR family transcriptional regulator
MNNCIVRINESLDSFSKQVAKVARYVLNHQDEVIQMTISELAKKSKSSTATIVRFATILGFRGYRDFIKNLYHDVVSNSIGEDNVYELDDKLTQESTIKQTVELVSRLNIEALTNTLKIIDDKCVERAVNAINTANRLCIYALSGSTVVAEDALFKFDRLGINCRIYDTPHSQILSASNLNPEDVALFLSYSGETKDIIAAAEIAADRQVKTISITKFGENTLTKTCGINIQHSSLGKGFRSFSTRSRVVQSNIIDILFVALSQRRSEHLKKYYELFNYPVPKPEGKKKKK